jgi:hypothetical protein
MYVAGILADNGWNIYFPRRDKGFDFIITKPIRGSIIVRPVQVKGKYPETGKHHKSCYGYTGGLSAIHPDMVLALAYFPTNRREAAPVHIIAYMPRCEIRDQRTQGFRCVPAHFKAGKPEPRETFTQYFDHAGMQFMESPAWGILPEQ